MVEIQLLRVPFTYEAMQTSVSLTGITWLKERSFHSRIAGSKEFVQIPVRGIVMRKDLNETPIEKKKKKRTPTITQSENNPTPTKEKTPRSYTINKKEVSHRIRNFVNQQTGKKKLYFWTVTFPPATSDNTAFILLNKWLTRLRKENLLRDYIWVSERQKNGTIHFHIAIPHYLDVKKANKYMRASIMHSINKKEIEWERNTAKNYNGVDIAKHRKTKRITNFASGKGERALTNYLTKYVTKNNDAFEHLAWHCSRAFSNIIIAFRLLLNELQQLNLKPALNQAKLYENDWITFMPWLTSPPNFVKKYLGFINNIVTTQLQSHMA